MEDDTVKPSQDDAIALLLAHHQVVGDFFCPGLEITPHDGELSVSSDQSGFDRFLDTAFA